MIRTTHAEIKMLRAGSARDIPVPTRRAGAPVPPCPLHIGTTYPLLAVAAGERKREVLHALATDARFNAHTGEWVVTFRAGQAVEQPRYLRARPGRAGSGNHDYTTVEAQAVRDEPEPVAPAVIQRQTADARTAEELRDDHARQQHRDAIEHHIAELERLSDPANRGRIQGLRAALRRLR